MTCPYGNDECPMCRPTVLVAASKTNYDRRNPEDDIVLWLRSLAADERPETRFGLNSVAHAAALTIEGLRHALRVAEADMLRVASDDVIDMRLRGELTRYASSAAFAYETDGNRLHVDE